jgi:outer membrane lipoprotein-sorting protein
MPSTIVWVVVLLAGSLVQPGAASKQSANSKQSVDEIVAASLRARGGVEALKGVTSIKRSGHTTLSGSSVPVTVWAKRPNLFRREMELPALLVILAYDGHTFWSANARDAAGQTVPGPPAERAQEEAAFDTILLDYKAKGHKVELVGTERQGDRLIHHLKVLKRNGKTEHYYLDAKTGLETRVVSTAEMPGGVKVEIAKEFSDYRPVKGILVPFHIRDFANDALVSETTLDSVEINVRLEDSLFRMPTKGQ